MSSKPMLRLLFLLPLLSGCTAAHRAALKYGEDQAKAAYDTEARLLIQGPCAMNVGSYWRALNGAQRGAVDVLCGR